MAHGVGPGGEECRLASRYRLIIAPNHTAAPAAAVASSAGASCGTEFAPTSTARNQPHTHRVAMRWLRGRVIVENHVGFIVCSSPARSAAVGIDPPDETGDDIGLGRRHLHTLLRSGLLSDAGVPHQ